MASDPHECQRFIAAQENNYAAAIAELCAAVGTRANGYRSASQLPSFPASQLAGLGRSAMQGVMAFWSIKEARAYLDYPTLGARRLEWVRTIQGLPTGHSALHILADVDAIKLRSSLTLFEMATDMVESGHVLVRWCRG